MKVKEAMTRDPITIGTDTPLSEASELMRSRRLRHLPVVDDAGRLVGIITDRDVRHAVLAPAVQEFLSSGALRHARRVQDELQALRVKDVMTWAVMSVNPESPLGYAVLLMSERRIGCLPVVDSGHLVGLLTEHDALALMLQKGVLTEFDPDAAPW